MTDFENYLGRETSWLKFNERVLEEAFCKSNPALERLKFLAISGSNLDEFFMVRVGGLKVLEHAGIERRDLAGRTPVEQLDEIRDQTAGQVERQYTCLLNELEPLLASQKITRRGESDLAPAQLDHLRRVFDEEVSAVLAPIAIDSAVDFPLMIGSPTGVLVRIETSAEKWLSVDPDTDSGQEQSNERFAVIPIGKVLSRFVTIPSGSGFEYILLEDVVRLFADRFFPNQHVVETAVFRVTRNADLAIDEGAGDLLAGMQQLLDERKTSDCIRLELSQGHSDEAQAFLTTTLNVAENDIYVVPGPIDLSAFMKLGTMPGHSNLVNENWPPILPQQWNESNDVFDLIGQRDRLLCHPYQSYDPVVRLMTEAANDPDVIAIKQILYRTSRDSAIIDALLKAAANGKKVTVVMELKARFDEARNIHWARQMERSGIDVIHGVQGLKTHAKTCIIVRRQADGIARYCHFGTGNYNESTARLYGDISLITCDQQLGTDAVKFFNAISGMSVPQAMDKLVAAPLQLRERLLELINVEAENARRGRPAKIDAKINSLADQSIIDALYLASQAGVKIRLNVRGICCLRPGVPDVSENVRVISIIDRFLEHARIVRFHRDGDDVMLISSADWMGRNLDRRVELLVPVEDAECKHQLGNILDTYFKDNVKARELNSSGEYHPVPMRGAAFRSQQALYKMADDQNAWQPTVFQPIRSESSAG